MRNRLFFSQLVHAQHFVRREYSLNKSIQYRTEAIKSAKKRSLVDKPQLSAANLYSRIKPENLIGVVAGKTDQYPSTSSPADAKAKRAAQQV